ncbi:MAG: 4-(cytidine 5'-diphospho)-2-C-methyl-D-erythritol kinase [Acidobacteria bacterium]|nr:4-(cytidine 5'-diphospho)-2-C-methyl-D-erythritol kinase [Acidobacteriota bacterium]
MPALSGKAFAKVNLGLRILERRPDGFHELRTVFQTISLADRLRVSHEPGGEARVELRCSDPALESDDNLAARAARELLARTGCGGTVRIELEKRIPHGAGLGGGSSDAAAVLTALDRLLEPKPSGAVLYQAAAALGSDVPFFLLGGRAVGLGRGEEVYPLPETPAQWMLLLVPGVRVATAEAYRNLAAARGGALTPDRKGFIVSSFCSGFRAPEAAEPRVGADWANDFEETVFQSLPDLELLKQRLREAGAACALLSGSGSALFGMFGSRQEALAARRRFKSPGSDAGLKTHVVRTVGSRECRRSWNGEKR